MYVYKHNSAIHPSISTSTLSLSLSDVYLYISKVLFSAYHIKLTIYLYTFYCAILTYNSTISSSPYNFPNKAPVILLFCCPAITYKILRQYIYIHLSVYMYMYVRCLCTHNIYFSCYSFNKICNPFSAITALKHNNNGFVNYLYNRNLKTRDFRWNF